MKRMSDEDFMAKCRNIDFSADSQNFEANLDALKGKLTQIVKEERHIMKRSRKFSIAIAAVLAAIMIPVAAFAAAPAIWEYFTITITRSDGNANHITFNANDLDIETLGDGSMAIRFGFEFDSDAFSDMDDKQIMVRITEGAQIIQMDVHSFDDLDEALSHLAIENLLLPAYLPEGFAFELATLSVHPGYSLEDANPTSMHIFYSDGQNELRVRVLYTFGGLDVVSWGVEREDNGTVEVDINGVTGRYKYGSLFLEVDNVLYLFESADLSAEQLTGIAESLQ